MVELELDAELLLDEEEVLPLVLLFVVLWAASGARRESRGIRPRS